MQYVGKVGDYVYNQWNSLNPATLSGAIDIIVIEQPDGSLHCLPWHVRFGKFLIIKPLQKKVDLYVNDFKTDLPMKLSDGGEAFFVFETDKDDLSSLVVTSPVISAASSPSGSLSGSPASSPAPSMKNGEPEALDLNGSASDTELKISLNKTASPPPLATPSILRLAFEKAKKITQKLNIPSKIDLNGDMVLDMDGYKPNAQKNIDESDELVRQVFLKEMHNIINNSDTPKHLLNYVADEKELSLLQGVIRKDKDGKIRIINCNSEDETAPESDLASTENLLDNMSISSDKSPASAPASPKKSDKTFFKTLRLTSDQLALMKLNYGHNKLKFKLSLGNAQVVSDLYFWKSTTPIVISDIDGTITKSDALGHVLNMFGKDWTHPGVANLFQDISRNGYNIVYLTARSVGQADTTRAYLESINQDGVKLPKGPVILSPDRTMAALKREIILKKPEVFKMACLRDINSLYFSLSIGGKPLDEDDDRTPFYAGFGNRITDAISYRSVKIPSHRIFTINPYGEVHMELLELAGYRSSYLHIGELVDHFFPPLKLISDVDCYWNQNQFDKYMHDKKGTGAGSAASPGSPGSPVAPNSPRSLASYNEEITHRPDEKFTDLNYWREPMAQLSDFSDLEDDEDEPERLKLSPLLPKGGTVPQPGSPQLYSVKSFELEKKQEEQNSILGSEISLSPKREGQLSSFTSPLKSFMMFGNKEKPEEKEDEDEDDEDDDDYTDDDYDDDYTDDDDYDEDEDVDDEDLDLDDGLPGPEDPFPGKWPNAMGN